MLYFFNLYFIFLDPLTDPIMDEEAKKVEIELAKQMQKHNIKVEQEEDDGVGGSGGLRSKSWLFDGYLNIIKKEIEFLVN